ncbi:hypothetical protein KR074_007755 [Drosophila pseudoananassae]|nr:hypothetical protein KR074_007755 [Drosophila pseudoananassae]
MASGGASVRCINYYDLCRLCTDSADQKTDIFSPEGRAKNLNQKIFEVLSLQVEEKDRLPKGVCGQCIQTLEQMCGFRATCRNSQNMLSNCLSIRPAATSEKLYIRDAIDESGKSLGVVQASPAASTSSAAAQQPKNLLSSIMQAVNVQPQQQYTITLDNGIQLQQPPAEPVKSDKQTVLEEFIRLKPDIKITPLGKKDATSAARNQQPPPPPLQTVTNTSTTLPSPQLQLQPQLGDQLQPLLQQIQQLQLQQQLQQLTSQLNSQLTTTTDETGGPSDLKKPKLNFVISSPATPQFSTQLNQFGSTQPQIQLQLMPGGGGVGVSGALNAPVPTQINAAALLSSLATPQATPNLLSPNKCFLPITIRDENSDQQIVAHIDTKNLVLPTTYQVQMKLQPHLATADGQPIMQLTPTSIPATLQLTPQTLGGTQATVAQNQYITPQATPPLPIQNQQMIPQQQQQQLPPHTAQVTSQQIIRSPQSASANSQLVIRNVTSTATPTTPTSSKEGPVFKTPSPRQRPVTAPKTKVISSSAPPTGQSVGGSASDPKRLVTQVKQMPHVKQPLPAASTATQNSISSNSALQRLSSNTTITKVTKQSGVAASASAPVSAPASAPPKLPVINKQNITISRISSQSTPKPQMKQPMAAPVAAPVPAPAPNPQPIPVSIPALSKAQPPPMASQHKKVIRKPPENQESPDQKAKAPRPQQQILPLPHQDSQQVTLSPGLTCPTCNREFKKKEHLTQHVKLHAGLRPFKCSEEGCDKAFSRKEHLSRHLVSHSGQKMYTCEVCRKPFSRKDNLNKHKRIHTQPVSETLHCCDICNKNFSNKMHYEKHREMHTGKRPREESITSAPVPPAAPALVSSQVRSIPQGPNKDIYEMKQRVPQQQPQAPQQQQHAQAQPHQAQIMHVVTTQDLAGNTITITQAPDSNINASLANFVQLGFPTFQNSTAPANPIVCKIEK